MRLICSTAYRSIQPSEPFDLPDFTIIIGPNGAGKSHFLQAIANSYISVDEKAGQAGRADRSIILLDWAKIAIEGASDRSQWSPKAAHHFPRDEESFRQTRSQKLRSARQRLKSTLELDAKKLSETWDDWHKGPEAFLEAFGAQEHEAAIKEIFREAEDSLRSTAGRYDQASTQFSAGLVATANAMNTSIFNVSHEDFLVYLDGVDVNALEMNFAEVLHRYDQAELENDLKRLRHKRRPDEKPLTENAFVKKHGLHPADELSELLQQFNLPYRVHKEDVASLVSSQKLSFQLEHISTGAIVAANSLSSGETTILRFLLAFFEGDPRALRKKDPRILLLDEVDASLHPPMVQTWLEAIHREFVLKRGIKCIIATHTPTTVAVAPGDCIYEKQEGVTAPQKIDRQTAIRKLTFGIPTLSINVNANRQVFTESDVDTMVLNELHSVLADDLGLPRNLVFSSCGLKVKPSTEDVKAGEIDINTGCAIVRKIVGAVHGVTEGNVYGVVDWDLKAKDQGPVFVLAQDTHYALENVILDPLLLAFLAMYERKFPTPHPRITQVTECPDSELQQLADVIAYDTLGFDKAGDTTQVLYRNGRSIKVPTAMARHPAHPLEERVVAKLEWLKANRLTEGPKFQVVKRVIFTLPEFCPMSIVELFERIATDGDIQPGASTQH